MTEKPVNGKWDWPWKHILVVFVFQAVALAVAAWFFRHALNPDAVAYLRIAFYYAQGNADLAVSGYWGPLISWVAVPLLKLGLPPLGAARLVMGFSAMLFLAGCLRVFFVFHLSEKLFCCGAWGAALVSIPWSVECITPDLMLSGLICFAVSEMVSERWPERPLASVLIGLCWGLAYLCKAVALPLAILTSFGMAVWWWRKGSGAGLMVVRNLGLILLGMALVSLPWISVISAKGGRIIVSQSAELTHSMGGPTVSKPLYPLDLGFRRPEPGRITLWENPPLPYPKWSPFAGVSEALHQLQVIADSAFKVLVMLTGMNLAFPALAVIAPWVCRRGRGLSRFFPVMLPVAVLVVLYVPNYIMISDQRFFYPAFPFLFVATVWLFDDLFFRRVWIQRHGAALLVFLLLAPTMARSVLYLPHRRQAGDCAWSLAQRISGAGLAGPVAGSGMLPGGRAGLYTAFLLDQPWFGDAASPNASDCKRSGASLIVVRRGREMARELGADGDLQNLDSRLFSSPEEAAQFPLQVFKTSLSP